MTPKQKLRNKAAQFLSSNKTELEMFALTGKATHLENLIHALHIDLIETWLEGVGMGANLAIESESKSQAKSAPERKLTAAQVG